MMRDYPQLRPLLLAIFTDVLGMSIIAPILPVLAMEYDINALLLGFLISSNALFGLLAAPISGKASDRHGRKPVILVCQAGTIAGFGVLAVAESIVLLLLARVIDGLFSGQVAVCQAVVSDVVPPEDRGKQMTTIGTAFTLAYIFGPSVGSFVYQWHGLFGLGLTAAALATANIIFTATCLPETRLKETRGHPDPDPPKTPLPAEGTGPENPEPMPGTTPSVPTPRIRIRGNPRALYLLSLYAVFILTAATFETTISLFSYLHAGLSVVDIGFLFTAMALFQVIFRTLAFGPLHARLGDVRCVLLGFAIYLSAYILLGLGTSFWRLLPGMLYLTLGAVFTRGILVSLASQTVDQTAQGKITGVVSALDSAGQIGGPFLGAFLLLHLSSGVLLATLVGLATTGLLLSSRLSAAKWQQAAPETRASP